MSMLIAAAVFFLSIHLLIAGTKLRDFIVGRLGERGYLAAFSFASVAGIVWLVLSYNAASSEGSPILWDFGPAVAHLGIIVVAIAFFFGVSGLLTPNPASVGMENIARDQGAVTGILRITRHPFLWGVAVWSAFHLGANGDAASVVFFGTFLALAVFGTFSIDTKRRRNLGGDWKNFEQTTSNFPFQAILAGHNSLVLSELLTYRQLIALLAFATFLVGHAWAFGASPFPGGWVPF